MALLSAQNVMFPNSSNFGLTELLKYVQENGIDPIWAEADLFDTIIEKVGGIDWGQEHRWALNADPGGGSVARIAQQGGRFAPGDRTRNLLGKIWPKYQTVTYQFERFMQEISGTQAAAYIENSKQEYEQKNAFTRTWFNIQLLGDGTGRLGTPAAFGASDAVSGLTFTIADPDTPLEVKMSPADTAAGSIAHLTEGMMVSFVFYDAASVVRLLAFSMADAGTATTVVYDAFRVVEADQFNNRLYLLPGRQGTTVDTIGSYDQLGRWCSASASGVVTATTIKGIRPERPAADAAFADAVNLTAFFAATNYPAMIHPLYVNESQAYAKLQLGIGWTSATDLSIISDGVVTGLEAHLMNQSNTIHNINRASTRQYLATIKNNNAKDLTFNTLYAWLAQNATRNRKRKDFSRWSAVLFNPIVMSSLISLSELDRRITEGKGIRGEDGAKMIKFGNITYELDMHSSMRLDRVMAVAKGSFKLYDCKLTPVSVGGQNQWLTVTGGNRINSIDAYSTMIGEACLRMPRDCGAIRNFKISKY